MPIGDWLASYKLVDYVPLFEGAGYDTTEFLQGLTTDELVEIGVVKPGHKKKILAALSSLRHKEHLLMSKPVRGCSFCRQELSNSCTPRSFVGKCPDMAGPIEFVTV